MIKMKLGFYVDDEGAVWLLKPGKKGEYYSDHFGEWREWGGTYEALLTWLEPKIAEWIGL